MEIIIPKGFGVLATIIITVSSFIAGAAWWGATISSDVAYLKISRDKDSQAIAEVVRSVSQIKQKLGISDGISFSQ